MLLAMVVYVIAMLALFPARLAWHWFAEEAAAAENVQVTGITGSIWRGQADQADINGIQLSDISWSWRASDLLQLGYGSDLAADAGAGPVTTSLTVFSTQSMELHHLRGQLPIPLLLNNSPYKAYIGSGMITVDLEHVHIHEQIPVSAEGYASASDLSIALFRPPVAIGSFDAILKPSMRENGAIDITVTETDLLNGDTPPLKINLEVDYNADGCYTPLGYIEPTASLDPRISRMLGQLDSQGRIPLNTPGCLPMAKTNAASSTLITN